VTDVDVERFGSEVDGHVIRHGIRLRPPTTCASWAGSKWWGSSKWLTWRASDERRRQAIPERGRWPFHQAWARAAFTDTVRELGQQQVAGLEGE